MTEVNTLINEDCVNVSLHSTDNQIDSLPPQAQIVDFCRKYNIPIESLAKVLNDPKVVPMIRGKSFEYDISKVLTNILSPTQWTIQNPRINAQPGRPDVDVLVNKIGCNKEIKVEGKLAYNNSFNIRNNTITLKVKCMRSRTFSDNDAASRMANSYGVPRLALLAHADSYRETDFDFVVTSLGNSLWCTQSGNYVFTGTLGQHEALKNLFPDHFKDFQRFKDEAHTFLLFARSSDLMVSSVNNNLCTRRRCSVLGTRVSCGFIPNYPNISLNDVASRNGPWRRVIGIEASFNAFCS